MHSMLLALPQVLRWLRNQTAEQFPVGARMQVSPEQAQFLAWLVKATRSRKALELGVFTGYSSLAIAQVRHGLDAPLHLESSEQFKLYLHKKSLNLQGPACQAHSRQSCILNVA